MGIYYQIGVLAIGAFMFCSNVVAEEQWDIVLQKARKGETAFVIDAIKRNPAFASRYDGSCHSIAIIAARSNNVTLLKHLRDVGVKISEPESDGHSPLRSAAHSGHLEAVKFLLNCGAAPNRRVVVKIPGTDILGRDKSFEQLKASPFEWAVRSKNLKVVKLLMERGARLHDDVVKTNDVFVYAAGYHSEVIPDRDDPDWGNQRIICYLLKKGAEPNGFDRRGSTALIAAVNSLNVDAVELLLQTDGVRVDTPDIRGSTALYHAVAMPGISCFLSTDEEKKRSEIVVKMLLKHGADPILVKELGRAPWADAKYRELQKMLRDMK